MTRYVVGADGGNSKTDLVLASEHGEVVARLRLAGTQPHLDGLSGTAAGLADGARRAVREAGLPPTTPIAAAVFAMANVDTPEEEATMLAELRRLEVATDVRVYNDTVAALRAGSRSGWGVAVVCGAGINAIGIDAGGRTHRFLALGPETGDWGGGWSIGLAGLGAAVRAGDGRGPATTLRALIASALIRPDVETAATDVHHRRIAYPSVAGLTRLVFDAATAGDAVATSIVTRLADEVAAFATAALTGLDLCAGATEVVLAGAVLQAGNEVLLQRIRVRIAASAPAALVEVLDVAPVAGPVIEALQSLGVSSDAVGAARAQLKLGG